MVYDVVSLRNRLMRQSNYLARPGFASTVGWTSARNGHLLVHARSLEDNAQNHNEPTTCTVVGFIEKDRLYASPIGNHNPQYDRPFSASKFQMTVSCPRSEGELRKDWVAAITVLEKLQSGIGKTSTYRYLLEGDKRPPSIRLGAHIFEKMEPPNDDESDIAEFPTSEWPVPASHADALKEIADTHRVMPLVAYDENEALILPQNTQLALAGSLVEITFSLRHYLMGKKNEEKFDCFSGQIEQIVVIRPPGPTLPSPFRNFDRKSPWRPTEEVPETSVKKSRRSRASRTEEQSQGRRKETEQDGNSSDKDVFTSTPRGSEAAPTRSDTHPYTNLRPISKIVTPPKSRKANVSPTPGPSRVNTAGANNKRTSSGKVKKDQKDDEYSSAGEISDGESLDGYSIVAATPSPKEIAIEDDLPDEPVVETAVTEDTVPGESLVDEPPRKRTRTNKGKGRAH
ncbi:hypothetical protein NP233_g2710 [Leucocoprinus birnbaumii]|uniref:Uncharacterized protein n=1 Tax=Leucocoprinus birnbaumii TaxID=56174 RepID=A0AAD5VXX2_9AGAR|nr:hypothetical protein NP233_g2710 [Leucocoprinus birnbaumii]